MHAHLVRVRQAVPAASTASAKRPLTLTLATSRNPHHRHAAGESFDLTLRADRNAFAYCYYQDASGSILRVFPNRFQPKARLAAGSTVSIPGDAPFSLVPEVPNSRERVLCLATDHDLGTRLPDELGREDLTPLPVRELDHIVSAFRRAGVGDLARAELPIEVTP